MLFPAAPLFESGAAFFMPQCFLERNRTQNIKKGVRFLKFPQRTPAESFRRRSLNFFYTFFTILRQRFPQFHADLFTTNRKKRCENAKTTLLFRAPTSPDYKLSTSLAQKLFTPHDKQFKANATTAYRSFMRSLQRSEQGFRQLIAAAAHAITHHFGNGKIQRADHFERAACGLFFRHFLRQEAVTVSAQKIFDHLAAVVDLETERVPRREQ